MNEKSEKKRFDKQHNAFIKGLLKESQGPFKLSNVEEMGPGDDTLLIDDSI